MTESRKRLFFALWPTPALADTIAALTNGLVRSTQGRAVSAERLHVTLAFLHSVDAAQIPAIENAVRTLKVRPFDLILRSVGYWYQSRILWLGPGARQDQEAARELAHAIWTVLGPLGFTPERRPFQAHLTLARQARPPVSRPADIDPVCWPVQDFALVQSITGRRPAGYRVLQTFALAEP